MKSKHNTAPAWLAMAAGTALVALAVAVAPGLALAQGALPIVSHPVVQQLPSPSGTALSAALIRLGRNPQDIEALIDAGNAALNAGDTDAAIGFFTRADRLSPNNPRIVAGLAAAHTVADDAVDALPLFESIAPGAALAPERIADHGLAADLVGDNVTAQTYYLQAIAAGAGDEARRRLAISLAIAGDSRGSAAALSPLLQKQDRAAWRTRAFCLAILGQEEDAVAIAKAIMPADLAMGMAPYLRYMGRLTKAQQASAANLGHFPLPSAIGIDDARVTAWQQMHGTPRRLASGEPRPAAAPPTAPARPRRGEELPAIASAAEPPPEPMPSIETRPAAVPVVARPVVQATPREVPAPSFTAAPPAADVAAPVRRPSFSDAFAAFSGQAASAPLAAGAVDVRALAAARTAVRVAEATPPAPRAEAPASRHHAEAETAPASEPRRKAAAPTPAPTDTPEPAPRHKTRAEPTDAPTDKAKDTPREKSTRSRAGKDKDLAEDTPAKDTPAKDKPTRKRSGKEAARESDAADEAPAKSAKDRTRDTTKSRDADSGEDDTGARHRKAKPAAEAHPSRIWVQVGIGRSDERVAFDWKKMNKDDPKLFKGKTPSATKWGVTRRVLVGPFDSESAASAYAAKIKAAGRGDAFVWTSPAGQAVDPVPTD